MRLGYGLAVVAAISALAGAGAAQVTKLETPGNLAPTVDPGCIAVTEAVPKLSPPDLGLGVLACAAKDDWDRAVELYILMQLRAEFDKRRVADQTALQAEDVLSMQVTDALPAGGQEKLTVAFERFGGSGGPRHGALCEAARTSGPPDHDPSWMAQHGMAAFTNPDAEPLVPGFDPDAAWAEVLQAYMQCG